MRFQSPPTHPRKIHPHDPGNGGGFFYLSSSSGEVLSIPSSRGFEERYVLLDDASFFEVSGPLGAAQSGGSGGGYSGGGDEVAARLRQVFRGRAGLLRIAYAASVGPRSVEAMAQQVKEVASGGGQDVTAKMLPVWYPAFWRAKLKIR